MTEQQITTLDKLSYKPEVTRLVRLPHIDTTHNLVVSLPFGSQHSALHSGYDTPSALFRDQRRKHIAVLAAFYLFDRMDCFTKTH